MPLYTATLFLSAFLLFSVQPMFTKMVLPRFGGAPAVWNTAMVFFQAMLLGGYLYAHLSTRLLGLRRQTILHAVVLAAGVLVLPIGIGASWTSPPGGYEIPWLIGLLAVSVGLPFFALSATAPLLQQWFAHTDHPAAGDPYFLYGGSNLGSMVALLAYPVVIEPIIGVRDQSLIWTAGYALLAAAIGTCGILLWRRYRSEDATIAEPANGTLLTEITWRIRLRWLLLSLAPSALLLGATLHIGSEIAAVPFLWVIPLALYLLTFVLVFARRPLLKHSWMLHAQIVVVAAMVGYYVMPQLYLVLGLGFAGLFVTAMVCHGELAKLRPVPSKLTEFYLWMSLGGVTGGLFAAILAPLVFNAIYEYPIALVLALLLRPSEGPSLFRWVARFIPAARSGWAAAIVPWVPRVLDVAVPLALLWAMMSGVWADALQYAWEAWVYDALAYFDMLNYVRAATLSYQPVILTVVILLLARRRLRFAITVAIGIAMVSQMSNTGLKIAQERTFFGVYTVSDFVRNTGTFRFLYHGRINHGGGIVGQPQRGITYYAAQGPVGQFFLAASRSPQTLQRVAVTGLGTGAFACQVGPERTLTYFEIDPEVERLAREHFDYLSACGEGLKVEIGDGRLAMERYPDGWFDVIILDAFSGDAIPVHLLTREAFQLYLRKLSPDGELLIHITNIYLDLMPIMAATVADLGLYGRYIDFTAGVPADYIYNSTWVVAARRHEALDAFNKGVIQWPDLEPAPGARPWTDDFSNLFRAMRWNEAGVFAH